MDRTPWATYLWPGVPQWWRRGAWSALAFSIGFAAMVNLALAATLLWSELFTPGVRNLAWTAVVAIWLGAAILSYRWDRRHPARQDGGPAEDAFREALDHYLKGNWFEAEHVLGRLLRRDPRDLDAGMMLATLLRHTSRLDEAEGQLDRLERFDGCQKWELEIRRERELLGEARSQRDADAAPAVVPPASEEPQEMSDAA